MRVVGGELGGRKLRAPPGRSTRPTSDRVREAIFNMLHSLGGVEGWTVIDLFAGSGARGIEALSRGAASATFVDNDSRATETIRRNLRDLGLEANVRQYDAHRYLEAATLDGVDLAFADPPYAYQRWDDLLSLVPAVHLVVESDREVEPTGRWSSVRTKRYGDTVVALMTRSDS